MTKQICKTVEITRCKDADDVDTAVQPHLNEGYQVAGVFNKGMNVFVILTKPTAN